MRWKFGFDSGSDGSVWFEFRLTTAVRPQAELHVPVFRIKKNQVKQKLTVHSAQNGTAVLKYDKSLLPLADPRYAVPHAHRVVHIYTGWAKKVIPLVHILHCTRGITFLAHPVDG